MPQVLCDICHARPAAVRVAVLRNGTREQLDVCDFHYSQLMRHQRYISPLESLFGPLLGRTQADDGAGRVHATSEGNPSTDQEGAQIEQHFSQQAREILQRAAERAVQFGKREVDSEHLLYELCDAEIVQTLLKRFKISTDDIKTYIERNADQTEPLRAGSKVEIGISPRIKSGLDRAFVVSRELGHRYVGPEHLLIGLAEVPESFAGTLLAKYGLTPQALRQESIRVVGKGAEDGHVLAESTTPKLDAVGRDLTLLAREGKLDPVIGRSKEVEMAIEILARRKKNNPVLIGEPGVGKTAIVEGLAQRIVSGEVPEVLRGKRLVELNVNSLVAGAKYRGEFEERVKDVMEEITKHRDALLIFIDEVHTIVGAGQGGNEGGQDIANTFKPPMARGELNLIGATTLNEYQKYIEKDSALERRFQPLFVSEPTIEQTIGILRGLRDRLEAHHKVTIQDSALVAAAELSDRYVTHRFLPDKAIDLIDQAAARVHLSSTSRPAEMYESESEIAHLKREQHYATLRKQFDRAKALDLTITHKEAELEQATQAWKHRVGSSTAEVGVAHVSEVVSNLTGIPVADLTEEEKARLLKMEERLHERVVGQDDAIRAVSDAVRLSRSGLQHGSRPIANFLFLGPTGVGKTELAKALAEVVFGNEEAVVRIDMSEYMERHAVARLIGAPPGYVGYDEGGQLTERVRRRPYSVILLDEIEKAHPDVYNVLLQVFDDGRLTDGKGRVVDFSNALIIATSNLASDLIAGESRPTIGFGQTDPSPTSRSSAILAELRKHFRREFINRIDEIIVFKPLDQAQIESIVRLQLTYLQRSAQGQDIALEISESAVEYLAKVGFEPEFGARELKRQIRQLLEFKLARQMLSGDIKEGDRVRCGYDLEKGEIQFTVIRPDTPDTDATRQARLDEALEESFPASDPPAVD